MGKKESNVFKKPSHVLFTLFKIAVRKEWLNWVPSEPYLKIYYRLAMGKKLNLRHPQTFNEKLQWLKLYDQKPIYTTMVDKNAAKKYVADIIGNTYIIPTLGVWDTPEDIDFDKLPDKFVLKTTHDSGGIRMIDKKKGYDRAAINAFFSTRLSKSLYNRMREWPYKDVKPRIIAEEYLEDSLTGELRDYKFYCFNGEVKLLLIVSNRMSKEQTCFDYFDRNYNHLPIVWSGPNSKVLPNKPETFGEMIRIAEKLSVGIPHVRVDLYECNLHIYFGELTFFPGSGFHTFSDEKWDYKLGEWIKLPERS